MRLVRPSWLWALLLALSACSSVSTPSDAGTPDSGTQAGSVTGQVYLEGASSHGGVSVSLEGSGQSATSATDGRFTLESAPVGTHMLVARMAGYSEARQSITVQAGQATSVRLDLQRGRGSIQGTVRLEGVLDSSGVIVTVVETGATATSNSAGHFTLSGLGSSTYTLELKRTDYVTARQTVEVRGTGATLFDATLTRERGSIAGTIQLEGTTNHSGAVITLVEAGATATTNAQGHFRFENIMTGTYTLRVRRELFVDVQEPVTVRMGQSSQVTMSMVLVRGDVAGTVQLADGATPSGVTITVTQTGTTTTTNSQGEFTFNGLPLGNYTLTAQRVGYATQQQAVTVRTGAAATVAFTLVIARGRVEGTALLEGQSIHSGITITLAGTGATTTTDSQGRFTLTNISAGSHTVEARMSGYALAQQTVQVTENQAATVSLSLARERGGIAGVIQLEGSASPVDITVTLVGTTYTTRTNASGQFSFNALPTGAYTVEAQKDRFTTIQRSVTVRAGATEQLLLTMSIARGHISGVVQLEDAPTTSGISVAVVQTNTSMLTDSQGRFAFSNLPIGTYTVTAWWNGYNVTERSVEVRSQATTDVVITLRRSAGIVAGTVQLEGASNHEGVAVSLAGQDVTATTDAQGRFVLEGVRDGHHTLTARRPHYTRAETSLDVSGEQPASVNLSLARLGDVQVAAPMLAVQGGHMTLTGAGFGDEPGAIDVTVGGRSVTDFISWSDTQVVTRVAHDVAPGALDVVMTPNVSWRRSATASVRVLPQKTLAYRESWGMGIRPSNEVFVWGESYPLGNIQQVPEGLSDVVSVGASSGTAFAVKADGTVVSWGASLHALGAPAGLSGVVAVEGGYLFAAALKADGTVVAWGTNGLGESSVPEGLQDVVALSAGENHTLALKADGTVVSWGANIWGESDVPAGLSNVVGIASTNSSSLAVRADGTLVFWGELPPQSTRMPEVDDVVAIAGGLSHYVALRADGTVVSWGNDNHGQATPPANLGPISAVAGRANWLNIAIRRDGHLELWGYTGPLFALPPFDLVLRVPAW
ncbi:regulator of chromosome condensation, RCC1 [Myxococcus hansupus]|uniref:Regulator of chromosome condensation, RCC1 n=1 Tax=Pseudomyxococcus hansupus TaxID=1297742 RepID=A0A0H4WJV7_9BACT|nr:carboxypeptidase regulatory-like domain-containing protein [Myxococcus hansupus]AKQ63631.1 regulator of chromosome condensation, RCC1 [Myxococcus hansupus]